MRIAAVAQENLNAGGHEKTVAAEVEPVAGRIRVGVARRLLGRRIVFVGVRSLWLLPLLDDEPLSLRLPTFF